METEQRKSLLIIKSKAQSLGPVEGFLRNRDWNMKSTSNLKEALDFLINEQPQFVMISLEHPNKKVRNLAKVLASALPVCVIPFCENASTSNLKLLNESKSDYAIFPPVTGPGVERAVNKYLKDLQRGKIGSGISSDSSGVGSTEHLVEIKGSKSFGNTNAQTLLSQLLGDSSEGDGGDLQLSAYASGAADGGMHGIGSGSSDASHSANSLGSVRGPSAENGSGKNSSGVLSTKEFGDAGTGVSSGSFGKSRNNKTTPSWAPIENEGHGNQRKSSPKSPIIKEVPQEVKDSLIYKGTTEALQKSSRNSKKEVQPVGNTSNLACIMVESSRFSGYLIAAMAEGKIIDKAFIEIVKVRLYSFLRKNGEKIEDNHSLSIRIREVPFEAWALRYAQFLRKSIHAGQEVAMAFFPRQDLKIKTEESNDEEMAAVRIEEFAADVRVEFNVYVYLARNEKYILYTPCGGIFFFEQKERLLSQGVSHLHVLKAEVPLMDKYRIQNFLSEMVDDYQKIREEEAA